MSAPRPEPSTFLSRESVGAVPWILGSKFVLFFAYFLISVLIVRGLGKVEYGIFAILKNLADLLMIACGLGMNAVLLRFIPELVVHKNRAGLIRLLWKTLAVQMVFVVCATALLTPLTPLFDRMFGVSFGPLIWLMCLSVGFVLFKSWYNDVLTALFLGKWVALLSFVQGVSWALLLGWLVWRGGASVFSVLIVEIASIGLSGLMAAIILQRTVKKMNWRSPPEGIGRRRVLNMGLAVWGGSIGRAFMMKYTETFFLGLFFGPAAVAVYDLGYSSTMLVITFIPMALQTIFASGVSEAYVRDPNSLPGLVTNLYKVLILLAVPVAAFGVFFSPTAVVIFYGEEMREAGWIASSFCAIHLLPLIAIPLSMAIGAKEKVKEFLPLLYFRVAVNIALDLLLIPFYGIPGALAAVVLTFLLTFPLRLRLIRSILGGFHFPVAFLVRFLLASGVTAGGVYWLFPHETVWALLAAAGLYGVIFLALLRFARLLRPEDLAEFRALNFAKLNRFLDLIAGRQ
ncbi:MAG: polysaccharide biosynthesis C-terminal domain-containing protein [Opitutales bacterium]|nr:polysaccharide biosynthesis C-terminal domain-containing protein [Opitutales bacterium]